MLLPLSSSSFRHIQISCLFCLISRKYTEYDVYEKFYDTKLKLILASMIDLYYGEHYVSFQASPENIQTFVNTIKFCYIVLLKLCNAVLFQNSFYNSSALRGCESNRIVTDTSLSVPSIT